jgi:uncharacterized protein YqeY
MSELAGRIESDLKTAMKAQDKGRMGALRMVIAALKNKKIEKRADLTDEDALGVLSTLVKQRKESIEMFKAGNREDLVEKETQELAIIQAYMPSQMGEDEVRQLVREAVQSSGAAGPKDMGKVMGVLMPKVKGRADGKLVNELVRKFLAGEER